MIRMLPDLVSRNTIKALNEASKQARVHSDFYLRCNPVSFIYSTHTQMYNIEINHI